jgi:hypothetical protein
VWTHRIDNDPLTLGLEIEAAGPEPEGHQARLFPVIVGVR